ncbi:hypothetical protein M9Y10_003583 [Tritrichomonas musculus]|uniref:non-specific serine/threonine protein kinase n=1 Tax=Tritrichomonas musculus TaxID=1915356 RepID=A0ABR2JQD2_9EUKA
MFMNSDKFIGKRIGIFKILSKIDDGTYSKVYLAEESIPLANISKENNTKKESNFKRRFPLLRRYVACKIIPREKIEKKNLIKKLGQEIRVSKLMHHPNVLQFIDFQKDSSYYYIFQEYVPCGELFDMIHKNGKFSEDKAAILFKQILLGLQYIHSLHVAHRNLKPQNILVDQFGRIKIGNFGISKVFSKDNWLTKTPCGSPYYLSPECISGLPYDAAKSDLWSCGVILYVITTGCLPWTKRDKPDLFNQIKKGDFQTPSNISECSSNLISRLMTIDVEQRITIEQALNHPFLINVDVPCAKIELDFETPEYVLKDNEKKLLKHKKEIKKKEVNK